MKLKDLMNVLFENESVKIVDLKHSRVWKGVACEIPWYYHERVVEQLYSSFIVADVNKYIGITIK